MSNNGDTPSPPPIPSLPHVTSLDPVYRIRGEVVHGLKRGAKQLGFPTANLSPDSFSSSLSSLHRGVYLGWCQIDQQPIVYPTVLSLGTNPTFDTQQETLECYIMHEFADDFYGHQLSLIIIGYLRPSYKLPDVDTLKQWIHSDIKAAEWAIKQDPFKEYQHDPFFQYQALPTAK